MKILVLTMVSYLQRNYSDIRVFSENLLKFCEFLAHLIVHCFRAGVERGDEEMTEMYCAALFILHVAIKLDQVCKWPFAIGIRSDRSRQRTYWQYLNPEHLAANRRCPLPTQFDFHVLPPGLEEYGPSIRVMAYLMWGKTARRLRDQVNIRIRNGVEFSLNDPDGRDAGRETATLGIKQVLKLGRFLNLLETDGRKQSAGWSHVKRKAAGRYKRWMRVCGLTEHTEIPETTSALDILAENRYLDHVRTVTELVSRKLPVERRPSASSKRPNGDNTTEVADKRSRTDYDPETRTVEDISGTKIKVSVPGSPDCVDLPPTPDVIALEEELPTAPDIFHPEGNPGGRIPGVPRLKFKEEVPPDTELHTDEPSEGPSTVTPTPSSPFPDVEILETVEAMEDALSAEDGSPAAATSPAPATAPTPAPAPAGTPVAAAPATPGQDVVPVYIQDLAQTMQQMLTGVRDTQKTIIDRLTNLELEQQRMTLTSDLQLNLLRQLQQDISPTSLATPLATMPGTEMPPARTPTPDIKLGTTTPLPDVAALAIAPVLPALQPNPLYVAPAPALRTADPTTDQMGVGGDPDVDPGTEAADTASISASADVNI